ncbi:MAG: hypothetical protein IKZ22_05030 [Kiritimatiellae bacterium]|nr:hypothetical protein [Kiritimatiellia bacterium]
MNIILLSITLLTNTLQIATAVCEERFNTAFHASGIAAQINVDAFSLTDESGSVYLLCNPGKIDLKSLSAGNTVSVRGFLGRNHKGDCCAIPTNLVILAQTGPREPVSASLPELLLNKYPGRRIVICGTVREYFEDEIDAHYLYLSLKCGADNFFAVMDNSPRNVEFARSLQDCKVRIVGDCKPYCSPGLRHLFGPLISCNPDSITIVEPPPEDPYDAELLSRTAGMSPAGLAAMGKRRLQGTVWAVHDRTDVILKDDAGKIHRVAIRNAPPEIGTRIETVGYPETDLYNLNMGDSVWREIAGPILPREPPRDTSPTEIFKSQNGRTVIDPKYHGVTVRLRGSVVDMPNPLRDGRKFALRSDGVTVPVDFSACSRVPERLKAGCSATVSGICLVEAKNWRAYSGFPHATGITLLVRDENDIVVTARPPWWTPARLLIALSSLLCAVIALFIWNRILNRLVSRRTQTLVKERLALAEAELKIGERTRLAIELHDSLSQNLAAVACQISATRSAAKINIGETMRNLTTTERMLLSCRSELRRCLWDLRNDAFDENNMSDVVRKVLAPVLGGAELLVDFNVPRTRLDDSTLHSIICIIRELTVNAIVHGHADRISVAGVLNGSVLDFSLEENGCGFDSENCPGPAQGHFGLAGVRERIERLGGAFTLKSQSGEGSCARVSFRISSNNPED